VNRSTARCVCLQTCRLIPKVAHTRDGLGEFVRQGFMLDMNILFLYKMLRVNGIGFIRSRYFLEELEQRGHRLRLAYFITKDKSKLGRELLDDAITFDEVSEFQPDALIFELGGVDRFPSREYLNELKRNGCIIVHCGLCYNDYNQHRKQYDEMYWGFGCGIYKKRRDDGTDELPNIRGPGASQTARTDVETLKRYCSIRDLTVFENVPWVESHFALVIKPEREGIPVIGLPILLTSGAASYVKAYGDDIHGENYAIYGAYNDTNGIEILITGDFVTDGEDRTEDQHNRTFLINVIEYFHTFNPVRYRIVSRQASYEGAVNMLDPTTVPILVKVLDFLFGEGSKILQERRERRKVAQEGEKPKASEPPPASKLDSTETIQSKEVALSQRVASSSWVSSEANINHLLSLLETYTRNYYLAKEQYAKYGSALVPPIVVHNLIEAEDGIATTMKELQTVLGAVYGKKVLVREVEEVE
jgi:hypothetical protein